MPDTVGLKFVPLDIDGEHWEFPKLTPYDRAGLMRELKKARRTELLETLKLTGADKAELFGELQRFDADGYREGHFLDYILTAEGRAEVIRRSLAKAGRDCDPPAIPLDGELSLVAALCGVQLTMKADEEEDTTATEGDDPNDGPSPEKVLPTYSPTT